jgi:hypothetical protein
LALSSCGSSTALNEPSGSTSGGIEDPFGFDTSDGFVSLENPFETFQMWVTSDSFNISDDSGSYVEVENGKVVDGDKQIGRATYGAENEWTYMIPSADGVVYTIESRADSTADGKYGTDISYKRNKTQTATDFIITDTPSSVEILPNAYISVISDEAQKIQITTLGEKFDSDATTLRENIVGFDGVLKFETVGTRLSLIKTAENDYSECDLFRIESDGDVNIAGYAGVSMDDPSAAPTFEVVIPYTDSDRVLGFDKGNVVISGEYADTYPLHVKLSYMSVEKDGGRYGDGVGEDVYVKYGENISDILAEAAVEGLERWLTGFNKDSEEFDVNSPITENMTLYGEIPVD